MVPESPRKTVAIRGLDLDLYHEVFSMAKKNGKRVADIVNSALRFFLDEYFNGHDGGNGNINGSVDYNGKFVLKNNGEIVLSKSDIVGLNREVGAFEIDNTGHLIFDKDLDKDVLKNIERIVIQAGKVEVPRKLYPQFLLMSEIHGKLEKY